MPSMRQRRRNLRKDATPTPVPTMVALSTVAATTTDDLLDDEQQQPLVQSQLILDAAVEDTTPAAPNASAFLVVGYDDDGSAIYQRERPCASNDNPQPYEWNCTDVPTSGPTYMPSIDRSFGSDNYNGGGAGSGSEDAGAAVGEGSGSGSGSISGNGSGGGGGATHGKGKLAYECSSTEECNRHRPGDDALEQDEGGAANTSGGGIGSATGGGAPWKVLGPCNFHSSTCPDPYATQEYSEGDQVSVAVDRWVYTCTGTGCNDDDPGMESVMTYRDSQEAVVSDVVDEGSSTAVQTTGETTTTTTGSEAGSSSAASAGWKLTGGCRIGRNEEEETCPETYDGDNWYVPGDVISVPVSVTSAPVYGTGDGSNGSDGADGSYGSDGSGDSGSGELEGSDGSSASVGLGIGVGIGVDNALGLNGTATNRNATDSSNSTIGIAIESGSTTNSTTDPNPTEEEVAHHYAYDCTSDRYCNSYPPGNSLGLGWTLNGTCQEETNGADLYSQLLSMAGQGENGDDVPHCPRAYNETKSDSESDEGYARGDQVTISSDYLNARVIGSISCPNNAADPSESSSTTSGEEQAENNEVLVPYVYEVETIEVSSADVFLPRLEEQILLTLADSMMSCIGVRRMLAGGFIGEEKNGRGGEELKKRMLRRALNDQVENGEGAEFAVRGIRSSPDDMAMNKGPCTISVDADNCFIINGKLTLLLNPINDTSYNSTASGIAATDEAQSNLQHSMENDALISPNMPEVIKIAYLGDSYDDYMAGFVVGESELAKGGVVVAPLPIGGGGDDDDDGGGGAFLWGMLGGIFGALIILLLALLFIKRRRRKQSKFDQAAKRARRRGGAADSQAVGGDFDWEDWNESFDANDPESLHGSLVAGRLAQHANNGEVVFHVDNLSPNTSEEQVRELFEQHGSVNNCIVPVDHQDRIDADDGAERFALLTMPSITETERAEAEIACNHVNGLELDGHVLIVKEIATLYVGNLSPNTGREDVRALFEQHGTVTGCTIPADHEEGDALGGGRFALVSMPANQAAEASACFNGLDVDGSILNVRDMRQMNGGRGMPGGGLAAAALAAGAIGAVAAFNCQGGFNPQGSEEVTLHAGNLSPDTAEDDVRQLFEEHGAVTECVIPLNNAPRRYALVTMPADEAENAMNSIDGVELDGYQLSIREAGANGFNFNKGRGMEGRSLIDDASSAFDNSYSGNANRSRRGRKGRDPTDDSNEEDPPGARSSALGAIGTFIAAPLLLGKSFRKNKSSKNDLQDNQRLAHLESITGRSYQRNGSPDIEEQSLDDGLESIINTIDDATDTVDRRNFVVDPPGAFHLGNHHYTGDGVRYFSPLCELCIAARADEDGVVALKVIDEEDTDDESAHEEGAERGQGGGKRPELVDDDDLSFNMEAATRFTDFNANDLGRCHSSMHVRHCKSKTCSICQREKQVFFVKARRDRGVGGEML